MFLFKIETDGVDAVSFATRSYRTVVKKVPEMRPAVLAVHLGTAHTKRIVFARPDIFGDRGIGKRRPAGARIELVFRREEDCSAVIAAVDAGLMVVDVLARKRRLGPVLKHYPPLLGREFGLPAVRTRILDIHSISILWRFMKAFFTRIAPWAILLAAFLGLADSVYLARSELSGAPLLCNIDGLSGCNLVAQSPYSQLFGVPLAVYGLGFYALLFILAALELAWSSSRLRKMLLALTLFGVAVSLVSLLLQLFVIQALCIYCAFSWAVALLAWLFSRLLPGSKFWRREHLTDAPS